MKFNYLLTFLLIGTIIISPIACGKSGNELIGKWKCDEQKKVILEVFDNKTFKSNNPRFESGHWDILKDRRIQFTDNIGKIVTGSITGGKLRLEFADYIENYKKINIKELIVGHWRDLPRGRQGYESSEFTFNMDGSGIFHQSQKNTPLSYAFVDDSQLNIQCEAFDNRNMKVKVLLISPDELVFSTNLILEGKEFDDVSTKLIRVK